MDKWSFNYVLFSRLSEVLDISGTEIAKRCGMSQQVLSRYTTNEIVVSVQIMMKICNSLRMPIHFFVSEDNNNVIPNREAATIPIDYWHPILWDTKAVERTFGDGDGRIYWKDVAEVMGVTQQKPHERFLLNTRFPVTSFLSICSHFNITPFRFLVDKNRDYKGTNVNEQARLLQEISELQQNISDLDETVKDLTCKYRELLERHSRMEHTLAMYFGGKTDEAAEHST